MWLMTQHGFFSIIRNAEDTYYIRARVKRDLENLDRLMGWKKEILRWETADYRYRLIVTRDEMLAALLRMGEHIDYSNFKGRIHGVPDQKKKSAAYSRVWETMEGLQE